MNEIIKLITARVNIHHYSSFSNSLIKQLSVSSFAPKGKYLVAIFAEHAVTIKPQPVKVQEYINQDIGVVYICDVMPDKPIVSPNILYIETGWKWFLPLIFLNPLMFKAVDFVGTGEKVAMQFASLLKNYRFNTPRKTVDFKDRILFDLRGGVGDCLLVTAVVNTLIKKYNKKVDILAERDKKGCFENIGINQYICNEYVQINVEEYEQIYHLDCGDLLNDYRLDLNKQHRLTAMANICGLDIDDLLTNYPIVNLTDKEKEWATEKLKGLNNTIFLGFTSARPDTCISPEIVKDTIIPSLKAKGYTIITASLQATGIEGTVNFDKQLTIRQLFALIYSVDYVLSVDTGYYHIANAFNKPTTVLMNYFNPDWRCFERQNQKIYTPKWQCFPCVSGQFVAEKDRQCNNTSCFNGFDWKTILNELPNRF